MDKKLQIILAGMKLFVENDIQATPMSAIAKEAKTGMGTIYNYFSTKEELINAIYLFIKHEQIKKTSGGIHVKSIKLRFEYYVESFINYQVENPVHFYFTDQYKNSPILTAETKAEGKRVFMPFLETITTGQDQKIIKQMDINELIYFLDGGLTGFLRWTLSQKRVKINHQ